MLCSNLISLKRTKTTRNEPRSEIISHFSMSERWHAGKSCHCGELVGLRLRWPDQTALLFLVETARNKQRVVECQNVSQQPY